MNRTLLYGADGQPAVVEMGPEERNRLLLIELFGLLIQWKGKPAAMTVEQALPIIADIVTPEALMERFKGLELEVTRRPHASGRES